MVKENETLKEEATKMVADLEYHKRESTEKDSRINLLKEQLSNEKKLTEDA